MKVLVAIVLGATAIACGDRAPTELPDPLAGDHGCAVYVPRVLEPPAGGDCASPDMAAPDRLATCTAGSGSIGRWTVDAAGLPAYDFLVDQRCDPRATAYSPRATPLRDPLHVVGNGRGLVAMARASGALEIYGQDRGHKWFNRVDLWQDPEAASPDEFPPQLGGGFGYYTVARPGGAAVLGSTRFEDLPVDRALASQSRRFGTGYYETETRSEVATIRHRVLAPDDAARALVAEVTIENPTRETLEYGFVEVLDVNLHQVAVELLTSDLLQPDITDGIERRRRALAAGFRQRVAWDAENAVATVETRAAELPAGVAGPDDPSPVDWFPEPVYLALLDDGPPPDAIWLTDQELWPDGSRTPPAAIREPGDAASRALEIAGEGQRALLAIRVAATLAPGERVTRRFALGYAATPAEGGLDPRDRILADLARLRARSAALAAEADASWRRRLVWAAFPDLPDAARVQREIAWATYATLASSTYDAYRRVRLLGQGGSYKYIHGLDGAMGDLALFAESVFLIDPELARDTLTYALASQHGGSTATPWRYPYASTGVGDFSDVVIYAQRSDAYYFVPSIIAEYAALTRDFDFLSTPVPYWPRTAGETGTVAEHIDRGLDYGTITLGFGARGIVAMGTNDYADGIALLATEPATPQGTSSTFNAGMIATGFPLLGDVLERQGETALAERVRGLAASQSEALITEAWNGDYFLRGFVDSGNPLAPHIFFVEPQVFPVLAGIASAEQTDGALAEVVDRTETALGAVSNVPIGDGGGGPVGGVDQPLVGGIWPVVNAWLTAAYARLDADAAWSSFTRNTLGTHAELYPDLWYGIWTGPDSFNGPQSERPGEADAHLATALTDYPALNVHVHVGPLRALTDLLGVEGTAEGVRITPRVPTETFHVAWPSLAFRSRPEALEGALVVFADGPIVLDLALPSGLRSLAEVHVTVDGSESVAPVSGGRARLDANARRGEPLRFRIAS